MSVASAVETVKVAVESSAAEAASAAMATVTGSSSVMVTVALCSASVALRVTAPAPAPRVGVAAAVTMMVSPASLRESSTAWNVIPCVALPRPPSIWKAVPTGLSKSSTMAALPPTVNGTLISPSDAPLNSKPKDTAPSSSTSAAPANTE